MEKNNNELMHYGIPGMRWGKGRKTPMTAAQARVAKTKAAYKAAKKQYSKDFSKSSTLYGAWGPGNKERHNKTYESALKANKAEKAYKKAKKDAKIDKQRQKEKGKAAIEKAKANYKAANKKFNKAYRDSNSWILNSQFDKADNKKRNDAAYNAAQAAERAKKAYKAAKKKYR